MGGRHPTGSLAVYVIAGNTNFGTAPFFLYHFCFQGIMMYLCVSHSCWLEL